MSRNRIRDLREDRDLRQADVAEATGIDQRTLSNYETGKTSPDSFALIKLADFFDVSIDYLLRRTELPKSTPDELIRELEAAQRVIDDALKTLRRMRSDFMHPFCQGTAPKNFAGGGIIPPHPCEGIIPSRSHAICL